MPMKSTAALMLIALTLTACAPSTVPAGATDAALCRAWGESLPSRSRADTEQTAQEIGAAYADFAAACPDATHLIPRGNTS